MVDINYLKKRGVSSAAYKKLFTLPPADRPPALQRLIDLISERIRSGRDNNLRDYKAYAAIDLAYEAPFSQTTPTIVQSIINKKMNAEETLKTLKAWGLSEEDLFTKISLNNGATKLVLNPPVFFQVFIPLVKAYVTIRAAKLFNDRNQNPLLPYRPLKQSDRNLVLCDIITDFVNSISTSYGYASVMRSAITQMVKYGVAMAFPREEWHVEEQVFEDQNGKPSVVTVKEGLRYIFPHPSRMGYDLLYPATTINTDTGMEYGFHWGVSRYGDILDNRMYWNRKSIAFGNSNWFETPMAKNYFAEVYPCTMEFPKVGSGIDDRETRSAYSSTHDRDAAIFKAEFFMKLVPSRWGLADYKYPVWHRFTLASDDTVIWAAPCAYVPIWMMGYDYDDHAAKQSSFALECIPWQDHLGNILSQMILTAKQNLTNVTYYDSDVVDKDVIDELKNSGEAKYRSLNFVPYSGAKLVRMGASVDKAFQNIQFQFRDVSQLGQSLSTALNIMERVLQMSAQEVGAAAQHYQSAKEIAVTQNATTNRLNYTASFVDDGVDAWKRQIYEASMAYADTDVMAEIDPERENLAEILGSIGFENKFAGRDRVIVKGKKDALRLDGFARWDSRPNRESDKELAQIMYQTISSIAQKEELFNAIGVKTIVSMLEEAAHLQGARNDFRLKIDKDATPGGIKAILQNAQQQILQFVQEKIAAPAAQEMANQKARVDQVEQVIKQLQGIYNVAQSQMDKNQMAVAEAQQRMQIRQAEFEQEQARKQQTHEMELQRKAASAQVEQQTQASRVQTDIEIRQAEVAAGLAIKAQEAEQARLLKEQEAALSESIDRREASVKAATVQQVAAANVQAKLAESVANVQAKEAESQANVEATKVQAEAAAAAARKAAKAKPKTATAK